MGISGTRSFGVGRHCFQVPLGMGMSGRRVCLEIGRSPLKTWDLGYNAIRSASGPYASYYYGLLVPTEKIQQIQLQ